MTEIEQWAAWYGEQGLVCFPLFGIVNGACRCPEGAACENKGKHPRVKWKTGKGPWTFRPTDNVGLSTDNLVVVDLDGDVSASVLADYPRTFTTSTGHGFHLWYRADPTKTVKSVVGWKHKVDVRAHGGLIVAPPSRHSSGSVYSHVQGDSIQPVPRTLLDSLPERGQPHRRIGYEVVDIPKDSLATFRAIGDLLVEEMSNTSENRNSVLFRLGCRYFELAAMKMLGQDVLEELMSAALQSGLSSDEVVRTLDSARKSV